METEKPTIDMEPQKKWACTAMELRNALQDLNACIPLEVVDQYMKSERMNGFYTRRWKGDAYGDLATFKSKGINANAEIDDSGPNVHRNMELIMNVYMFFTLKGCTVSIRGSGVLYDSQPEIIVKSGEYLNEISGGRKIVIDAQDWFENDPVQMLTNFAKAIQNDMYFLIVTDHYENEEFDKLEGERTEEVGEFRWHDIKKAIRQLNGEKIEPLTRFAGSPPFIPQMVFPRQIMDSDWGIMSILYMHRDLIETLNKRFLKKATPPEEPPTIIDTIEKFLLSNRGPYEAEAIASKTGIEKATVTTNLCRLVDKKCVFKEGRGFYYHKKWITYWDDEHPKREVRKVVNRYM